MIMALISNGCKIYAYCMYVDIMYILLYIILYSLYCDSDNELQ